MSTAVPTDEAIPADNGVSTDNVPQESIAVEDDGADGPKEKPEGDDGAQTIAEPDATVPDSTASDQTDPDKAPFIEKVKAKIEKMTAKFPKDKALRMLFWANFVFILAGIVLLLFAIIWISICRGTTFGAYSVLLFIAAVVMSGISLLNILLLCKNPEQVFCHAVISIVTFFVFVALLILAIILGGFHILTINFEYAVFKMDFEYFQDALGLDNEAKIKAVDDGYFYMALVFGIITALIIVAMFVVSTIVCCQYVQCNYCLPFFCGMMPFMVGIFGIVFAISLASVGIMTRTRYSFIYNPQGWIIFAGGGADIVVSFILLGGFFGMTCKSDRNDIDREATYPEEGYFGDRNRSDVLGFDFWNCKHEFCILLWLNVLVCTPVFVVVLVFVVITGGVDHTVPLPCGGGQLIDHQTVDAAGLLSLSSSSFMSLSSSSRPVDNRTQAHVQAAADNANFSHSSSSSSSSFTSLSSSSSHTSSLSNQGSDYCTYMVTDPQCYIPDTAPTNPNTEWEGFSGQCAEFKDSAARYSLGLRKVSVAEDYVSCSSLVAGQQAQAQSSHARLGVGAGSGSGRQQTRTLLRRTTEWLSKVLNLHGHGHVHGPSAAEAEAEAEAKKVDTMMDTLMAMDPEELEGQENVPFEFEGEKYEYSVSNGATNVVHRSSHISSSSSSSKNRTRRSNASSASASAAVKAISNAEKCYDYSDIVVGWKHDIETFGADMCVITGFAMLIPAAPILALDGVIVGTAMVVAFVVVAWFWMLMAYYCCHIIMACCCQREVVDDVQVSGNTITTYYHIEDYSPDFNCCICCGIVGCCQFICLFSACVLAFCLKDDWCGISCNKADRRKSKVEPVESSSQSQLEGLQNGGGGDSQQMDPSSGYQQDALSQPPQQYSAEQYAQMMAQGQQAPYGYPQYSAEQYAQMQAQAQTQTQGQDQGQQAPDQQALGQQVPVQRAYSQQSPYGYPQGPAPPQYTPEQFTQMLAQRKQQQQQQGQGQQGSAPPPSYAPQGPPVYGYAQGPPPYGYPQAPLQSQNSQVFTPTPQYGPK